MKQATKQKKINEDAHTARSARAIYAREDFPSQNHWINRRTDVPAKGRFTLRTADGLDRGPRGL